MDLFVAMWRDIYSGIGCERKRERGSLLNRAILISLFRYVARAVTSISVKKKTCLSCVNVRVLTRCATKTTSLIDTAPPWEVADDIFVLRENRDSIEIIYESNCVILKVQPSLAIKLKIFLQYVSRKTYTYWQIDFFLSTICKSFAQRRWEREEGRRLNEIK